MNSLVLLLILKNFRQGWTLGSSGDLFSDSGAILIAWDATDLRRLKMLKSTFSNTTVLAGFAAVLWLALFVVSAVKAYNLI